MIPAPSQNIKSDVIAPNVGPYAAAQPLQMTNQAMQAVAARKARKKEVEDAKQEKYRSMLAELEAPWVRDAQAYHEMKKAYNKKLADYHRENGRIDLTDPELLQGYQQLKDFAVYSKQTKKAMEDVMTSLGKDPTKYDDIHFRRQWEQLQSITNPFERAAKMSEIQQKGGFVQERYLNYGDALNKLEPTIRGLKMHEFEGTGMNNKRKTIIAQDYIAQQVKNQLQSPQGMKTWGYILEGELDAPNVDGYTYEDVKTGEEKFVPVNIDKYRQKYQNIINANTDANGQLTEDGYEELSNFMNESNEEFVQAYSQRRAMEYVDQWNYQQYKGSSPYKKKERPTNYYTVKGKIPVETKDGKFTAQNYGGPGKQKAQYFPISNLDAERLGITDADEAAVTKYYTLYGQPEDTYVTLILKQAEQVDYDDAYDKLSADERALFDSKSQQTGNRDIGAILDAAFKDGSIDKAKRNSIEKKIGWTGKGGVQRTFPLEQVMDIVQSDELLWQGIQKMWQQHTPELDAIPVEEQQGGGGAAQNNNQKKSWKDNIPAWMRGSTGKKSSGDGAPNATL